MKLHSKILALLACLVLAAACGTSSTTGGSTPLTDTGNGSTDSDAGAGTDAGGAGTDTAAQPGTDTASGGTDTGGTVDQCSCKGATPAQDKECGFIPGCPKSCGSCGAGKKCVNNKCTTDGGGTTGLKKTGEFCGPTKDCQPPPYDEDEAKYQQAQQQYYSCLNAQCEGGTCLGNICTQQCKIKKDEVINSTGEKGQDGIEDPDVDFSDCIDAKDGPKGKVFRCVEYRSEAEVSQGQSLQFCYAGITFAPCKNDKDCKDKETCQLQRIYGNFAGYCAPEMKNPDGSAAQTVGKLCNANIIEGDIKLCNTNDCTTLGCMGLCKEDADCMTEAAGACKAGKCGNGQDCKSDLDCSAFYCNPNVYLDEAQTIKVGRCWPKTCQQDTDCPSEDYFCRLYYNGVQKPQGEPDPDDPKKITMPGWKNLCVKKKADSVKVGEKCDPFSGDDDETYKPCGSPYCVSGMCSKVCGDNKDCPSNMKCNTQEINWDLDNDKVDETFLNYGICTGLPGQVTETACYSKAGCKGTGAGGKDQYCKGITQPWKKVGEQQKWTYYGQCIDEDAKAGLYGDSCGKASQGKICNSGLCLSLISTPDEGVCTDMCDSRKDCKDPLQFKGNTFKSYCRAMGLGGYNATSQPKDDYYGSYCLFTYGSSLDDCSKDYTCKATTEACRAFTIVWGPDKAAKAEYFCQSVANNPAKQGDPPPPQPTGNVGDACDLEAELYQCKTLYCLRDVAAGKGYCSKPCKADADCGAAKDGMYCNKTNMAFPGVPRDDAAMAAVVPMCMKKKSCIPCEYDFQCAGGYKCSNLGGSGTLSDLRCAPPCETDKDCAGADGGTKCVPAKDDAGKELTHKVCAPSC